MKDLTVLVRSMTAKAIENNGHAESLPIELNVLGYRAEFVLSLNIKHLTDVDGNVMSYQSMKQQQFKMDLDKLLSGNYALVPIYPTAEMMKIGTGVYYSTTHSTEAHNFIAQLWAMMLAQGVQS